MADPKVKRRKYRAGLRVKAIMEKSRYAVFPQREGPFDMIAIREKEIRFIQLSLDEILEGPKEQLAGLKVPSNCYKEIWIQKEDDSEFEVYEVL